MSDENRTFTYEILEHIGTISVCRRNAQRWKKEINIVSWNRKEPRIDIREWTEDHKQMSKGLTLTATEMRELYKILYYFYEAGKEEASAQ